MTDVSAQLKNRGWRLTAVGIETLTNHSETVARDVDSLERAALHFDLSEIGSKWLQDAFNRARSDCHLDGTYVLQVFKVKPPSTNPRDAVEPQCKVFLTDGIWNCPATLTEVTNKLVTELVVGAKVLLFGQVRLEVGTNSPALLLSSSNMRVLGGSTKRSGDAAKQQHRAPNGDNTNNKVPANAETEAAGNNESSTNATSGNAVSSKKARGPAKRSATQSQSASECDNNVNVTTSGDRNGSKQNESIQKSGESERPGGSFRAGPGRGAYRGVVRNPPHFPPRNTPAAISSQATNGDRPAAIGRERSGDRPAETEWVEGDRTDRDRTERPPPRSTVWDFLPQTIKDDANAKRGNQRGGHSQGHNANVNAGSNNDSPRSDTPLSGGARDAVAETETQTREAGSNQPPAARGGGGNWRRGGGAWQANRPPKRGAVTRPPAASDRRSFPPTAANSQNAANTNANTNTTSANQDEPAKLPPRLTRQKQPDGTQPDGEEQAPTQTQAQSQTAPAGNYGHHHGPYYHQRAYYDDYQYRGGSRGRGNARGGVGRGYAYGRGRGYGFHGNAHYHGSQAQASQNSTNAAGNSGNVRSEADAQAENNTTKDPSQTAANTDRSEALNTIESGNIDTAEARKNVSANATDDEKHGAVSVGAQSDNADHLRRSVDSAPQTQSASNNGTAAANQAGPIVSQQIPNMNMNMNLMIGQPPRLATSPLTPMLMRPFGFQLPPFAGGGIPYIPPGMVQPMGNQRFVNPAFYQPIFAAPGPQMIGMHPMVMAPTGNPNNTGNLQVSAGTNQQGNNASRAASQSQNTQPAGSGASQARSRQQQHSGTSGQSGEAQAYQPQAGRGAQSQGNVQNLQRQMQTLTVGIGSGTTNVSVSPAQSTQVALDPSSGSQSQSQAAAEVPTALHTDANETQITAVYQNYLAVYRLNQIVRARVLSKSETPSTSGSVSTADEAAGSNGAARFVKATIRRIDGTNKSLLVVLNEGELTGSEQWTSLTDVRPHYDKPPELSAYRTAEQHKSLAPSQSMDSTQNSSPPATGITSPLGNQSSTGNAQFNVQQLPFDASMMQQPVTPTYSNPINVNLSMNLGVTIVGNQPPMLGAAGAPPPHALSGVMLNAPYGTTFVRNMPMNMNVAHLVAAAQHGNVPQFGAP